MAAGRSLKSLVSRRRRADEEGEDEDGSEMAGDSQSEGSVLTDGGEGDEDADADAHSSAAAAESPKATGGSVREAEASRFNGDASTAGEEKARKSGKKGAQGPSHKPESQQAAQPVGGKGGFQKAADTEAMMKGLKIDDGAQNTVDFESMQQAVAPPAPSATNGHSSRAVLQRQRQDDQDYQRRRDTDPTFISNRGNFYTHDTSENPKAPGPLAAGPGRGRGRGGPGFGTGFLPGRPMAQPDKVAESPWRHDLHETINEEPPKPQNPQGRPSEEDAYSARLFGKPPGQAPASKQSFSSTVLVAKAQIRVAFPGIKEAITYSDVPVKRYVRLPEHRSPMRRDKPVRVSLPDRPPRYIFPSPERSFIFIPRQNRPGQQPVGRSPFPRHAGSYGYNSRRNSVFGGSVHSASVAPSRRSSLAREVSRESAFSPTGSHYSGFMPPTRPLVRLPDGGPYYSATASPAHTPNMTPQTFTYPLPQEAHFQGTPATAVHQPRPQKQISVSGIESPAVLQQASQDQQPFANQLPAHMSEPQSYASHSSAYYSPHQQLQYPYQQHGTPLSGIPEASAHAPAFSPSMHMGYPQQQQQQSYYPPYQPQPQPQPQGYYYPPEPAGNGYYQMPPYYPAQQQAYQQPYSDPPAPQPTQPLTQPDQQQENSAPSGMVAHESNGMVYYLPADQAPQQDQGNESYQPAESFVPSYAAYAGQVGQGGQQDGNSGFYYGGGQEAGMWYPGQ